MLPHSVPTERCGICLFYEAQPHCPRGQRRAKRPELHAQHMFRAAQEPLRFIFRGEGHELFVASMKCGAIGLWGEWFRPIFIFVCAGGGHQDAALPRTRNRNARRIHVLGSLNCRTASTFVRGARPQPATCFDSPDSRRPACRLKPGRGRVKPWRNGLRPCHRSFSLCIAVAVSNGQRSHSQTR